MIQIHRGDAPAILDMHGPRWAKKLADAFDAHQLEYLSGVRTMRFAEHVYGAKAVREALADVQNHKCCYCEVEIEHPYMLRHVEHWRPKGAVRQTKDDADQHPGYYWLAYDWENLFLACGVCNSLYKKTVFPLADESVRARSHHDDVTREVPTLLKPDIDDPEEYLMWVDDQPQGLCDKGWSTIKTLGLIRENDPKRSRAFASFKLWRERYEILAKSQNPKFLEIAADYRRQLEEAVLPQSPFSAMAKAFLASHPPP